MSRFQCTICIWVLTSPELGFDKLQHGHTGPAMVLNNFYNVIFDEVYLWKNTFFKSVGRKFATIVD